MNMKKGIIILLVTALVVAVYPFRSLLAAPFAAIMRPKTVHPRIESTEYMFDPIQIATSGNRVVRVAGTNVNLEYVAEYSIAGRVLGIDDYSGQRVQDIISPRDVALAWGWLTDTEVDSRINWGPYNYREFLFSVQNDQWLRSVGGVDAVISHTSNNHLLSVNNEIRRLINDIEVGDFIKIEGYLVNMTHNVGRRGAYFLWSTSTSRTDTDCEVIYVTNVTWLQGPSTPSG